MLAAVLAAWVLMALLIAFGIGFHLGSKQR
jgi:hypothetical protein